MYLRFTTFRRDEDSHRGTGLFQVAYEALEEADLEPAERDWIEEVLVWFENHVTAPPLFIYKLPRRTYDSGLAIFWWRDTAREPIRRMRELAAALREQGIASRVLRTSRPGHVIYEDRHQVAAVPYGRGWREPGLLPLAD